MNSIVDKKMFPALENGIVYLDNAATTFMPKKVSRIWTDYHDTVGVFVGRGTNCFSKKAEECLYNSEKRFHTFFGLNNEYSFIYSKNVTEGINLVAVSLENQVSEMDMILVGPYEHHSNYLPWKYLAKRTGAVFCELPLDNEGNIDYSYISRYKNQIKIISVSSVSNVFGYRIDIDEICNQMSPDTILLVDDSQLCAHSIINNNSNISVHFIPSHKMYGPKNIALIAIKNSIIEKMSPVFLGGGMVESVGYEDVWLKDRNKFFAGTMDIGLICAMAEACSFLSDISFDSIKKHDEENFEKTMELLYHNHIDPIYDPKNCVKYIVSFVHPNLHAHDLSDYLASKNVIIRSGHLCSQNSLRKKDLHAINRISFGITTNDYDIAQLGSHLEEMENVVF